MMRISAQAGIVFDKHTYTLPSRDSILILSVKKNIVATIKEDLHQAEADISPASDTPLKSSYRLSISDVIKLVKPKNAIFYQWRHHSRQESFLVLQFGESLASALRSPAFSCNNK